MSYPPPGQPPNPSPWGQQPPGPTGPYPPTQQAGAPPGGAPPTGPYPGADPYAPQPQPPGAGNSNPLVLIILGVVLLAVVGGGAFFLLQDDDDDDSSELQTTSGQGEPGPETPEGPETTEGPEAPEPPTGPEPGPPTTDAVPTQEPPGPETGPGGGGGGPGSGSPEQPFHDYFSAFNSGNCRGAVDQMSSASVSSLGGEAAMMADCQSSVDLGVNQDIRLVDVSIVTQSGDSATVAVTIDFDGFQESEHIDAVVENGTWKIHDI